MRSLFRALREFLHDRDQMQAAWFSCGFVIMMAIVILGIVLIPIIVNRCDFGR